MGKRDRSPDSSVSLVGLRVGATEVSLFGTCGPSTEEGACGAGEPMCECEEGAPRWDWAEMGRRWGWPPSIGLVSTQNIHWGFLEEVASCSKLIQNLTWR